jgi:hypothetical protein
MSTLGLVDRNRHGKDTNSPASQDTTDENHGQIYSATLEYGTYQIDYGSNQDRLPSAKTVHRQSAPNV